MKYMDCMGLTYDGDRYIKTADLCQLLKGFIEAETVEYNIKMLIKQLEEQQRQADSIKNN